MSEESKIIVNWSDRFELKDFANGEHRDSLKNKGGLYLWVRKIDDEVWYVGETGDYLSRFREHFLMQIGGGYWAFDLTKVQQDWSGEYEPTRDNIFNFMASKDQLMRRVEKAYAMFEHSYFLIGEMENNFPGNESASSIRKSAEGQIIEVLRNKHAKYPNRAFLETIFGKISRHYDGKQEFIHNGEYASLANTILGRLS